MNVHLKRNNPTTTTTTTGVTSMRNPKKLRRLPHVFSKVLELPIIHPNANVSVQETSDTFYFTTDATSAVKLSGDVRAQAVDIYPGLIKVVVMVYNITGVEYVCDDEFMELVTRRFRLPACTRPDLATATCSGGQLAVNVPKEEDICASATKSLLKESL
ncbi:hypothetical protein ACFE04_032042 [Oxalis oulophora]